MDRRSDRSPTDQPEPSVPSRTTTPSASAFSKHSCQIVAPSMKSGLADPATYSVHSHVQAMSATRSRRLSILRCRALSNMKDDRLEEGHEMGPVGSDTHEWGRH